MADVYKQIYDYTKEILNENGGDFHATGRAFSYWLSEASDEIDVKKLLELDKSIENAEFIQFCYLYILDRAVDDSAYKYWEKKLGYDHTVFRVKFLRKLLYSPETMMKGKRIFNSSANIRVGYWGTLFDRFLTFSYFKVFLKMPVGFQKFVKRIAGK